MITEKIKIKPHLAEYANSKWKCRYLDRAVKFPEKSDITEIIHEFLHKRPDNETAKVGNLEIVLPWKRGGKNLRFVNYLDETAALEISKKIEIIFWYEFHMEMDLRKIKKGIEYNTTAYWFISKYNLKSISHDALTRSHRRYREKKIKNKKNAK